MRSHDNVDLHQLKRSVTLSHVVGADIMLVKNGPEFEACCPFHSEKTPSFTVNDKKGFFHCFGCGAHGDVFDWLERGRGMAKADHTDRLPEKIKADKVIVPEVKVMSVLICFHRLPVQRKSHSDRMFGDGLWRIRRDIGNFQACSRRSLQVNMVSAGRPGNDKFNALGR